MNQDQLTLSVIPASPEHCTIRVAGRLVFGTYEKLDQTFLDVIEEGYIHITVDLEGVEYISSSGFGIFIQALATVNQKGGSLRFVNLSPKAREIFRLLEIMLDTIDKSQT